MNTTQTLHQLAEETMLKIDRTHAFLDQVAHIETALTSFITNPPELEYRVLWEEPLGRIMCPFSGKVGNFQHAIQEVKFKKTVISYHGLHIEARVKCETEWLRPWD